MQRNSHIYLIILTFILFSGSVLGQTIQLTVTNGSEIRCADDSLLTVLITPNPAGVFTEIGLDWGDGSVQIISPGDPLEYSHTYNTAQFFEECIYSCGPNPFINGFCFQVSVLAQYADIDDENVSKIITYKIPPRPGFNAQPTTACTGNEVVFTNSTCPENDETMEYFWQFNATDTDTLANPAYTFLAAGVYSVTLTATNECGTRTIVRPVTVVDPAVAIIQPDSGFVDIAADTLSVCLDGGSSTIKLDGLFSLNESSYDWRIVPGSGTQWVTDQDTSLPLLQFSQPGTYLIILTVDNSCLQQDFDSISVTVVSGVSLQLNEQPDACISINYTPTPFNDEVIYTVDGSIVTTNNFPIQLGEGPHSIRAELSNLCGQQVIRDSFFVSAPESIQILSPNDTTICTGSDLLNIIASEPGGSWLGPIIGSGDTVQFSTINEGSFLVQYVKGIGQCEDRDSIVINVEGIEVSVENISLCGNFSGGVPLVGSPGNGNWSSPDCPNCIQNDSFFIVNLNGSLSAQIEYGVTNSNGCINTAIGSVEIINPMANFSTTVNPCSNEAISVDFSAAQGDLRWSVDGIEMNPPFNLGGGNHTIELVAITGTCFDSASQNIFVQDPPIIPSFSSDVISGCSPLEVQFSPQIIAENGTTYEWTFTGGAPNDWNQFEPPVEVVFTNDTDSNQVFNVFLMAENVCGTSVYDTSITVFIQPNAEIGIDSLQMGCSPLTLTLTNRSSGLLENCIWLLGDGTTKDDCGSSIVHTYFAQDSITPYIIELSANNLCGSDVDRDTIYVRPAGIEAFFNIPSAEICPGTPVQFEDASTPIPSSLSWRFSNGVVSNEPNPIVVFEESNQSVFAVLSVSTGCGFDTIKHVFQTLAAPELDFELEPEVCGGDAFTINNLSPTNYFKYIWSFSDGFVDSTSFNPTYSFSNPGNMESVTLTVVTFDQMCSNSITKATSVRSKPIPEFDILNFSGCAPLEVNFTNLSQFASSFIWQFGDSESSNVSEPGHKYELGTYDVTLIASDGICSDSLTKFKFVDAQACNIFIPNVFTPNDDGANDLFTVFGTENLSKINRFTVYSNWGGLLYEGMDLVPNGTVGWDGTTKDKQLEPGVFAYKIEAQFIDGTIKSFVGDVTLLR